MKLGGLQKLTLLDFPGHVACTVFTVGCNFRCPFCHNSPLLSSIPQEEELSLDDFFRFLDERKKILDGVAITGGEPLLHPDAIDFIREIKKHGYAVKLDTNGSFPERLKEIVSENLVDYVAMDYKNSREKLAGTIGTEHFFSEIQESKRFLMENHVPFEFRTTAVKEFHTPEDFQKIGRELQGVENYFIQCFKDSGMILQGGLSSPSPDDMKAYLDAVLPFIPTAQVRGVDL